MSELLESVKRLAKARKTKNHHAVALEKALGSDAQTQAYNESEAADILFDEEVDAVDLDALAKHLARLERVEATLKLIQHDADAKAFTAQKGSDLEYYCAKFARMADAALSENPDAE